MIFAHTLEQVIEGRKSQTRRVIKRNETFDEANQSIIKSNNRTMYQVGKTYAVQPNRGKKSVGRIQITGLRKERVDAITNEDAQAEGFTSREEFLSTWRNIHGKTADLSIEVWVFEFVLCSVSESQIEAWYDGRNRENASSHHSKNLSGSLEKIPGNSVYSRSYRGGRMGTPVSDRLSLSSEGRTIQEVSMD